MSPRKLPVIQATAPSQTPVRPPWQWVFLGAGLAFALWLPLAILALWLTSKLGMWLSPPRPSGWRLALVVAPVPLSYALACGAAGAILARIARPLHVWQVALAGAAAGSTSAIIALLSGSLEPWPVALASWLVLASAGALLMGSGYRIGREPM